MSTEWIVALSVVGPLLYALGVGLTWELTPPDDCDPELIRGSAAMFWPLALPAIAGVALARWFKRPRLPKATAREVRL